MRRPADAADFNGTVRGRVAQRQRRPGLRPRLRVPRTPSSWREGYAYVGVSAQATGVEGGGAGLEIPGVPEAALLPLKEWDPERYGPLIAPRRRVLLRHLHPGRPALVAEPATATRSATSTSEQVIAIGESQSACRMVTYVNAIQPATAGCSTAS